MKIDIQYPLTEQIGDPNLLVGREKEFDEFDKWIDRIPKRLSKSKVIIARRKSGKTTFVQRLFNRLWSINGNVIPFYYSFSEAKIWYPDFAIDYFRNFVSHYISFIERNEKLVREPLTLDEIKQFGIDKWLRQLVIDVDSLNQNKKSKSYDLMWKIASTAPERYASSFDKKILVIIDEFQYVSNNVFRDQNCDKKPDVTILGSWHSLVESKIAPMLITGSYGNWISQLMDKYLEAGRFNRFYLPSYLTEEEGLQAVYRYAEAYEEPITHDTAIYINRICMSDPFFISCVIQSRFGCKDLTTIDGVVETVNYEISDRYSEMSVTWGEYIESMLKQTNDVDSKKILLFMSKDPNKDKTPKELKEELNLNISLQEIHEKLKILVKSDLIQEGVSDIRYQGLKDGVLYLILRNRFEEEINSTIPDLKKYFYEEIHKLKRKKKFRQDKLKNLIGKNAEFQLMIDIRTRKSFSMSTYFKNVNDSAIMNIFSSSIRFKFNDLNEKKVEIDLLAESDCGRVILVEINKDIEKIRQKEVKDFVEKINSYRKTFPERIVLPAFLSIGGFTDEALLYCYEQGIGIAEGINYCFVSE